MLVSHGTALEAQNGERRNSTLSEASEGKVPLDFGAGELRGGRNNLEQKPGPETGRHRKDKDLCVTEGGAVKDLGEGTKLDSRVMWKSERKSQAGCEKVLQTGQQRIQAMKLGPAANSQTPHVLCDFGKNH